MNLNGILAKQRWPILTALGAMLMVLVGVGDYFASSALLEFSVFFLIPVSFFTWYITRTAGIVASVASAAITLVANLASPAHLVHPRVAYWNALVWLGFFVLLTVIVAELNTLYHMERQLSRVDNLTRISNRLGFHEIVTAEMNRAQRFGQPVTLAYLDLDGFKQVNDKWGHAVGDRVLGSGAGERRPNHAESVAPDRCSGTDGRRRVRIHHARYRQRCSRPCTKQSFGSADRRHATAPMAGHVQYGRSYIPDAAWFDRGNDQTG